MKKLITLFIILLLLFLLVLILPKEVTSTNETRKPQTKPETIEAIIPIVIQAEIEAKEYMPPPPQSLVGVRLGPSAMQIKDRLYNLGGQSLVNLIREESNFDPYTVNLYSGACGLFQRLPCNVTLGDVDGQIIDGMAYINSRYGHSANAWNFFLNNGWY